MENEEETKEEKPKEENPMEKADRILKELEEQNKIFQENIKRQEEINAKQMLAGKSGVQEEKTVKEETPQEYKDRVMRGELNG